MFFVGHIQVRAAGNITHMPILNSVTANPTTVQPGGTSVITVSVTPDSGTPDTTIKVHGTVVGTTQAADVVLTIPGTPGSPLKFTTDGASAKSGDVLVTADSGVLVAGATAGVFTWHA